MFCPKCKAEYVEGYTRCADCGVRLVEALPEPEPLRLITVLASGDPGLMAVAQSLLRSAKIPFTVKGEGLGNLFGVGRMTPGGVNPVTGPMELQVRDSDAGDAELILAELVDGSGSRRHRHS